MEYFNPGDLKKLYLPKPGTHKGQNGRLMIIGGSHLFHGASIWAFTVASRIVDMVFYSSVPENNEIVQKLKEEFHDGIVVPRGQIEEYIQEADCILIGPGMVRADISNIKNQISKIQIKYQKLEEILQLEEEGEQTYWLTKYLLEKYSTKKWVIDAGSLQMMEAQWLLPLSGRAILTPHPKEFETLFGEIREIGPSISLRVKEKAREYNCTILLKGQEDTVCDPHQCLKIQGGNAGMTKGGTGDVLAGLTAALFCKNEAFLAACSASYINKKAGDNLYGKVGPYFNASDLANEIPKVMKELFA